MRNALIIVMLFLICIAGLWNADRVAVRMDNIPMAERDDLKLTTLSGVVGFTISGLGGLVAGGCAIGLCVMSYKKEQ